MLFFLKKITNTFIKGVIKMSYGKYKFENYQEFQALQNLAIKKGLKTVSEFNTFVTEYFSTKNK